MQVCTHDLYTQARNGLHSFSSWFFTKGFSSAQNLASHGSVHTANNFQLTPVDLCAFDSVWTGESLNNLSALIMLTGCFEIRE